MLAVQYMHSAKLGVILHTLKKIYTHFNSITILLCATQPTASVASVVQSPVSRCQDFPKVEGLQLPYILFALLLMMIFAVDS